MTDLTDRFERLSDEDLIQLRDSASDRYYNSDADAQEMSDSEFDALTKELSNRGFAEEVGHGASVRGVKVEHRFHMGSLPKVHTEDQVTKFLGQHDGASRIWTEPKLDGLALSLIYEHGTLTRAVKRGNGTVGELVTDIVQHLAQSPDETKIYERLQIAPEYAEIRGEILVSRSGFQRYQDDTENSAKNARNLASGILNRKSFADSEHYLSFVAYSAIKEDGSYADLSMWSDLGGLTSNSMYVEPSTIGSDPMQDIASAFLLQADAEFQYETDGVVIKAAYTNGEVAAIAFKDENEVIETTLREVEWNVSRTGRLVPVAIFDTVTFEKGVRADVSRATLNNYGFLVEKNVRIGDRVEVARANGVIPYFIGRSTPDHAEDSYDWEIPAEYEAVESGRDLIVAGQTLSLGSILHSLVELGSLGIAGATVSRILEAHPDVDSITKLIAFARDYDALLDIGFGERQAEIVQQSVQTAEENEDPVAWIAAMGVPSIGTRIGYALMQEFGSIAGIIEHADYNRVLSMDGFGPSRAEVISEDLREKLSALLDDVQSMKLNINLDGTLEEIETVESPLSGKRVVLTGTFPSYSRSDAGSLAEQLGAEVSGSVNSKTDLLIAGDKAGSKLAKAQSLDIPVMSAEEFESLVESTL